MPFTYQWEHEGQVCKIEESPKNYFFLYADGQSARHIPLSLALEFKHLVEENKRLQEGE